MSGHVSDRWHLKRRPKRGESACEHRKIPTAKHGRGRRWQVEYADPDGKLHYPCFDLADQADAFLAKVKADMFRGTYRDPGVGQVTLRKYVESVFLPAQSSDTVTRERVESALRVHILPGLGGRRLQELEAHPSIVQAWVSGLPLAPSSVCRVFSLLSTVMGWAVRDKLITDNPCRTGGRDGIELPKATRRKIQPWPPEVVATVRAELPPRWQAMTDAGTGTGARQGELFALAVENIDFLRRLVHVRVQVKIVTGRLVFAYPKGKAERSVPMARQAGEALAAHIKLHGATAVTLPWHEPRTKRHDKPHTLRLLFTTEDGQALNRNDFNRVWRDATAAAGLAADRVNGCHMMRHRFASMLIAGGIDVGTVSEYMGHTDGGALVLSTYRHLLPDAEDRARRALEDALSEPADPARKVAQNLKDL